MEEATPGGTLPHVSTELPGPRSRDLARRLGRVESRNITRIDSEGPLFLAAASGALIRDVDDNLFIDLTSGFGAAIAGHANPRVTAAIAGQAARLPHAMGDVHPAEAKTLLLERLAALAPGDLSISILGSAGAEAVEAALKTALLRTGRPGIVAFEGGYHGLTYGALAATGRAEFRSPFTAQLFAGVRFAPFPSDDDAEPDASVDESIAAVAGHFADAEAGPCPIGVILVEPVQGRGGIIVPPAGFLARLRDMCDGRSTILVFDEIYTGFGRTGEWFACQHSGVVPDIMTVGKALAGVLPISAAIGTQDVMNAWPASTGEAIHTSTFLGNPIACAAAIAQLSEIEEHGLVRRAALLGSRIRTRLDPWSARYEIVRNIRGLGLLQGIVMRARVGSAPAAIAADVAHRALQSGVLALTEGSNGDVLAITPPATITEAQLDHALDVVESAIAGACQRVP